MFVPSASVLAPPGPGGGATTVYLPLTALLSIVANAYGPVKYIPATPVWNALLVSVVVSVNALGCTTLGVPQKNCSNHFSDCLAWELLTVAVNLPLPAELKYSPPACHRNDDQYHDTYPRLVEPGTASP